MKKRALVSFVFALLMIAAGPSTSHGQISFEIGPHIGVDAGDASDLGGDFFAGADARIGAAVLPFIINPSVDYYFLDDATLSGESIDRSLYTIDLNALYEFGPNTVVFTPYAGVGVGITNFSADTEIADIETDDTSIGANFIAGARFHLGVIKPFVQAKINVGGDYQLFGVMGGLLFGF